MNLPMKVTRLFYMSSELEEFIGFCSRVLVFRNGSIFDSFIDDDVEPVGILEGMFGRVRKQGSNTVNQAPDPVKHSDEFNQ